MRARRRPVVLSFRVSLLSGMPNHLGEAGRADCDPVGSLRKPAYFQWRGVAAILCFAAMLFRRQVPWHYGHRLTLATGLRCFSSRNKVSKDARGGRDSGLTHHDEKSTTCAASAAAKEDICPDDSNVCGCPEGADGRTALGARPPCRRASRCARARRPDRYAVGAESDGNGVARRGRRRKGAR
jgi:hypothetical protein